MQPFREQISKNHVLSEFSQMIKKLQGNILLTMNFKKLNSRKYPDCEMYLPGISSQNHKNQMLQ